MFSYLNFNDKNYIIHYTNDIRDYFSYIQENNIDKYSLLYFPIHNGDIVEIENPSQEKVEDLLADKIVSGSKVWTFNCDYGNWVNRHDPFDGWRVLTVTRETYLNERLCRAVNYSLVDRVFYEAGSDQDNLLIDLNDVELIELLAQSSNKLVERFLDKLI